VYCSIHSVGSDVSHWPMPKFLALALWVSGLEGRYYWRQLISFQSRSRSTDRHRFDAISRLDRIWRWRYSRLCHWHV